MYNRLKWLCLFICVIGFFMSGMIVNTIIRYSVASAFFVGFIIVFVVDGMRSKHTFDKNVKNENQREEVIWNICNSDQTFRVTCPSGIGLGMFIMIFSALIFFTLNSDVLAKSFGIVMILFSFHSILAAIPRIGRPVLVLNKAGFDTPEYGLIPWEEVELIKLTTKTIEHVPIFSFHFHIPNLDRYRHQFGNYQAFLFQFRSKMSKKIATVTLRDANEQPEAIHFIAEELLKRTTKKSHMTINRARPAEGGAAS